MAAGTQEVYTPTASRIGAVGVLVIAVWWAVDLALSGDGAALARTLPWLVLACLVTWAVFWRPAVVVDGDGVTLRNPLRETTVPWGRLRGLDTKYALTLITETSRHQSWAAAAPGRPALMGRLGSTPEASRRDLPDPGWNQDGVTTGRASTALTSDSGAAAFLVDSRWALWQHLTRPASPDQAPVVVRWNVPLVAGSAVLVALGALLSTT